MACAQPARGCGAQCAIHVDTEGGLSRNIGPLSSQKIPGMALSQDFKDAGTPLWNNEGSQCPSFRLGKTLCDPISFYITSLLLFSLFSSSNRLCLHDILLFFPVKSIFKN